ncbi:MAG: hypothetical protein MUF21_14615 [Gemmatimonadaceae bacterium]|nr:hypothetical protein [Gemmatimonadaceae bacterium]
MSAIVVEVLAVLAGLGGLAFVFRAFAARTRPGVRLTQDANRRRIDRTATLTCPIHGLQAEESLVRLPDGSTLCASCYREAVHDQLPS